VTTVATGHVAERPFARTLYTIAAKRLTGDLVLTDQGKRYAIAWDGGQIVGAESAAATDAAGRIAVAAQLVTAQQVAHSLRLMQQQPGRDQIEVLAELAHLAPEHVVALRRRALAHRAGRAFALPDARFEVTDTRDVPAEPVAPLDPRWLIYFGLRTHYDEARLEREVASLSGKAVRLAPDAQASVAHFGFGEPERLLIDLLREKTIAVSELALGLPGLDRRGVLAALYALGACDCLAIEASGATAPPPVARAGGGATPSDGVPAIEPTRPTGPMRTGPTKPPLTAFARGAAERVRRLSGNSLSPPSRPGGATLNPPSRPPGTLDPPVAEATTPRVLAGAAPAAIATPPRATAAPPRATTSDGVPRRAGTSTTGPTGPTRPPASSGPIPARAATSTTGPIGKAGPTTRFRTHAGMASSAPPGDPAAAEARNLIRDKLRDLDGGVNHYSLLGVPNSATAEEIRTAYFGMAKRLHPDRLRAVGVLDVAADAQRLFAGINQAFAVLTDPAKRKEYGAILAAGGAAAVKKAEAEVEELAAKIFRAEEAFRQGEMALRRNQLEQARLCFDEAVALQPQDAEHQAMAAWVRWVGAENKDAIYVDVMKRLKTAVELSDACVPAHYYRAMVAKQHGKDDLAIDGFRKVLDLRPGHAEADLELRLLVSRRKKRESGGLFGKRK
jgi:hypothetical protein